MSDPKKFNQFSKSQQSEIEDIYFDGYWNIILKNYDRAISSEFWSDVKWMFLQMFKQNDYTLEW